MKREQRYGIKSLSKDFPTEAKVLEFLFDAQHSRECSCGGSYSLKSGRRQFQCSKCRYQIAPTANTLFHKSDTPLTLWFKAILTFSNAKSGVSAKEMERQLAVTYKTAHRMKRLIHLAYTHTDMVRLSNEKKGKLRPRKEALSLDARRVRNAAIHRVAENETALPQSKKQTLGEVRGAWHNRLREVVRVPFVQGRYGSDLVQGRVIGAHRQQREL